MSLAVFVPFWTFGSYVLGTGTPGVLLPFYSSMVDLQATYGDVASGSTVGSFVDVGYTFWGLLDSPSTLGFKGGMFRNTRYHAISTSPTCRTLQRSLAETAEHCIIIVHDVYCWYCHTDVNCDVRPSQISFWALPDLICGGGHVYDGTAGLSSPEVIVSIAEARHLLPATCYVPPPQLW